MDRNEIDSVASEVREIMNQYSPPIDVLQVAKEEGILLAPEAAATIAALNLLIENKEISKDEKIIVFGTGSGLTTPEEWEIKALIEIPY